MLLVVASLFALGLAAPIDISKAPLELRNVTATDGSVQFIVSSCDDIGKTMDWFRYLPVKFCTEMDGYFYWKVEYM